MSKLSKYIFISLIVIVLGSNIALNIYRKPIPINKTFEDAIIVKANSDEILKKTKIEINAKLYRGLLEGSILDFNAYFVSELEGTIIIDGEESQFHVFGKSYSKDMIGGTHNEDQNNLSEFLMAMFNLDSVLLIGVSDNWEGKHIVAPAKTIEDYISINNKIR